MLGTTKRPFKLGLHHQVVLMRRNHLSWDEKDRTPAIALTAQTKKQTVLGLQQRKFAATFAGATPAPEPARNINIEKSSG
jgi:hypothetical protein